MTTPELTAEQKPERPLLAAIFPDSGQSVPVVGDAYSVSKVTPNVLDFHDGYCTSIELTRNEEPNFTIEQALAELREMFPYGPIGFDIREVCQRLDVVIVIDGVQRGSAYNSTNALSEAMAQVRKWKEEQPK